MLEAYSRLYSQSSRLQGSLCVSYEAFLSFCMKCNDMLKEAHSKRTVWYKSSSLTLVAKSLWRPVKREFESSIYRRSITSQTKLTWQRSKQQPLQERKQQRIQQWRVIVRFSIGSTPSILTSTTRKRGLSTKRAQEGGCSRGRSSKNGIPPRVARYGFMQNQEQAKL